MLHKLLITIKLINGKDGPKNQTYGAFINYERGGGMGDLRGDLKIFYTEMEGGGRPEMQVTASK